MKSGSSGSVPASPDEGHVRLNSKYKGVSAAGNGWKSQAQVNGSLRYLGIFKTPEEAARQHDVAVRFGRSA
jgi:hypothetical protein